MIDTTYETTIRSEETFRQTFRAACHKYGCSFPEDSYDVYYIRTYVPVHLKADVSNFPQIRLYQIEEPSERPQIQTLVYCIVQFLRASTDGVTSVDPRITEPGYSIPLETSDHMRWLVEELDPRLRRPENVRIDLVVRLNVLCTSRQNFELLELAMHPLILHQRLELIAVVNTSPVIQYHCLSVILRLLLKPSAPNASKTFWLERLSNERHPLRLRMNEEVSEVQTGMDAVNRGCVAMSAAVYDHVERRQTQMQPVASRSDSVDID